MGRIGVEEAAAVGAKLLDGDLRGRRAHGDRLLGHRLAVGVLGRLNQRRLLVGLERLHHALRNQQQGHNDRQRQQDIERAADQVDPEVADRGAGASHEAADQRHQHGHAGGGRDEILHRQAEHLRQVAQRGLAAVALPVGVRGEADGRVDGQTRAARPACACGFKRQELLHPLQAVDSQNAQQIEDQHRLGVSAHDISSAGSMPHDAIDQPFEPAEGPVEAARLALVHPGHVPTQRLDQQHQDHQVEADLHQRMNAHANHSGFNKASIR